LKTHKHLGHYQRDQDKNHLLRNFFYSRAGMHNSNFMRAKKSVAETFAGQIGWVFSNFYIVSIKYQAKYGYIWALRAKLKAFTGHIWPAGRMLCMPALEHRFSTYATCCDPLTGCGIFEMGHGLNSFSSLNNLIHWNWWNILENRILKIRNESKRLFYSLFCFKWDKSGLEESL